MTCTDRFSSFTAMVRSMLATFLLPLQSPNLNICATSLAVQLAGHSDAIELSFLVTMKVRARVKELRESQMSRRCSSGRATFRKACLGYRPTLLPECHFREA